MQTAFQHLFLLVGQLAPATQFSRVWLVSLDALHGTVSFSCLVLLVHAVFRLSGGQ